METPKENWYGAGLFDSVNSTYKSKIYCTSGKTFLGYSKGLHTNEAKDKIVLLEKWIIRLANKGYFNSDKAIRIEFYLKSFFEDKDELIFTLTPKSYSMGVNEKFTLNKRLIDFLNNFYNQLENKKIDLSKLVHKPIQQTILSIQHKFLHTEKDLIDFIHKKQKEGINNKELMVFYSQYKTKWLSNSY